ncbi:surface polysaccharide O-acyltransferase-like enzyme [Olsenella profusa DSM 13989]|uniref:acyltransferase n=1 Tax=Olsenella profusa TaxID=138595 RepID=UPI00277EF9A1|nr:acyltransferase [Olsenella profusa]MDP9858619.1 surface polysaccharide O-acyltransferase-like enzyme [Olsenella profusa DSM 13989]
MEPTNSKIVRGTRRLSLDVIRSLAILSVLDCHLSGFVFEGSGHPLTASLVYSLGRIGVPLFVMLTGYLMLPRDYDGSYLSKYLKSNVLGLFVAYEIWNVLWYLLGCIPGLPTLNNGLPISIQTLLQSMVFMGETNTAMWYLQMILGIYLGIPIVAYLVRMVQKKDSRPYGRILLTLLIYFGVVVPGISETFSFLGLPIQASPVMSLNVFGTSVWGGSVWMVYLLGGYMISRERLRRMPRWVLAGVALLSIGVLTSMSYMHSVRGAGEAFQYDSPLYVCLSLSLFELIDGSHVLNMMEGMPARLIGMLSRWSFPTYMLHFWMFAVVLAIMNTWNITFLTFAQVNSAVALATLAGAIAVVQALCIITAWITSRVPLVAHWCYLMRGSVRH